MKLSLIDKMLQSIDDKIAALALAREHILAEKKQKAVTAPKGKPRPRAVAEVEKTG